MTYIIAEPCIDIKDKSCVDVCPVDCIHEFERILIIDPEECIDCFAPSEQFITSHGLRTFGELENTSCRVLTDSGFRPAFVKRFRRAPLVKVELAPAFEERDRYGRLLAYVYRASDGLFVNAELARLGYAQPLSIPPDVRHADRFAALAREARERGRGLWSAC